jgi:Carboxypeptidase regulatory-like domain/TonB dependent receptor
MQKMKTKTTNHFAFAWTSQKNCSLLKQAVTVALFLVTIIGRGIQAQTAGTGTIRGQILDPNGAAIVGAQVTIANQVTGFRREARTDQAGYYNIAGVPLTGKYRLTVSGQGFALKELADIELRAGEAASINVTLAPGIEGSEVTVLGTTEGVKSDNAQLNVRLDGQKIEETPTFGRKTTYLALPDSAVRPARGTGDLFLNNFLFIINGGGRRQNSYEIDGSSGDDSWGRQTIFTNIPLSALQEFTVLSNSTSAEYGRNAGGAINLVTKSGTNDFHGDFIVLWRPPGIQARPPASTLSQRTPDRLAEISGVFSGPIVKDRTHFLIAVEYNNEKRDSVITTLFAPGVFRGVYHQELAMGRVDHEFNSRHTLTGRFNFDNFYDTNPQDAVGANTLPSAARAFRRRAYTFQAAETAIVNPSLVNEARLALLIGSPITRFDPATPSTQFVRTGVLASTEGDSRVALSTNHQVQIKDTLSWTTGKQYFRFGGDIVHSSSGGYGQEFGSGFLLGQFRFAANAGCTAPAFTVCVPTSQLTIANVTSFTQSFGNATYHVGEWLWSGFAQDDWKVSKALTLNLGLRYDRQTFTDDTNNFAPRVGFAYNWRGDGKTVLRGSYGVYYSEIPANNQAAFSLNGPTGVFTYTVAPGGLGFPTSLAPLPAFPAGAVLPARDITIQPGRAAYYSQFFDLSKLKGYPSKLLNPYTQQGTIGVERELASKWILSVDYVWQHTIKINRTLDLNSPAPFIRTAPGQTRTVAAADATRPIVPVANCYKRILTVINNGESLYNGMQVNLNKRFDHNFSMLISYTWSHTINTVEPDAPGGDANDANFLGVFERGDSLLDQRHRLAISGWWKLPYHFVFGGLGTLASARPFNAITGVDNNGDASANTDRPVINGNVVGRNAFRGNALYDFSPFVEREFQLSESIRLNLRAEGFNVFNHANTIGRNGTYGNATSRIPNSTFGQTLPGVANVEPGRMFQFQARVRF